MADYTVTAANVVASTQAIRFPGPQTTGGVCVALTACTAGQPVYQDATTLKFAPADADQATKYNIAGISEQTAAAGQPITIVISDPAFTPGITTLATGDIPCLSTTAGGIAPHGDTSSYASGTYIVVLGVGISSTQMKLNPIISGVSK